MMNNTVLDCCIYFGKANNAFFSHYTVTAPKSIWKKRLRVSHSTEKYAWKKKLCPTRVKHWGEGKGQIKKEIKYWNHEAQEKEWYELEKHTHGCFDAVCL